MFVDVANAAAPGGASPGAGLGAFVPLIFLLVIFYFFLIRPQQKRAKEHDRMLDELKTGDTVITNGGVYGRVVRIDGHVVTLDCTDKCRLKVIKKAISGKVDANTLEGE